MEKSMHLHSLKVPADSVSLFFLRWITCTPKKKNPSLLDSNASCRWLWKIFARNVRVRMNCRHSPFSSTLSDRNSEGQIWRRPKSVLKHRWSFASLIWCFSWSTSQSWIISESDPTLFWQTMPLSTCGDWVELKLEIGSSY